ncbi:MAG: alcohol dehydrogenase catalytic domain-containing protein [Planctomycetota bacterium]|jgi:2-desacetyl-2-hydroxyethyl bacteriochlorophyllide A dehydrogenase|nr:alcohol dehydrogenase catalytic domain-containing protein [Planctomycetota bacterium]
MKAVCLEEPHKIRVKELPDPVLADGQALVEIKLCGVCGTEVGGYKGVSPVVKDPVLGVGHEAVGVVKAIGENAGGFRVGDRVSLEPYITCGECHSCREGRRNNCVSLQTCGVHRPGMMATLFAHPVQLLHRIPDEMSWERAVMIEPLSIGVHANHRAGVKEGERVLVAGAGPIGILAALVARAYGALPIIADPVEERLDVCRRLGFDLLCDNSREDLPGFLLKVLDSSLPSVAIDCSGAVPAVERLADCVRHGARVVFVGWPKAACSVDVSRYIRKELNLLGSRNSNHEFPESIELIAGGKVRAAELITSIVPLDEAPELIRSLAESPGRHLKAVVRVNA